MLKIARLPFFVLTLLITCVVCNAAVERVNVDHDHVISLAQKLAESPYQPPKDDLPGFLRDLSYDDYRRIRFVGEQSLWRADDLPFRAQFFHPGNLFRRTVRLNEFAPGFSQRIPFVRNYFDYQDLDISGRLPGSLEYAGFRVLHPVNQPDKFDEVLSFLGASYFRALGKGHRYGMSARGLAINFGEPQPEEFPDFVEFWLGKPAPDAETLTVHALLDSPSVTGAFTFELTPDVHTDIKTHATLFFRRDVAVLGLAPLTSMFWFGENSTVRFGDFRPEVHDSDGLLVGIDAISRAWRPIENPRAPRVTAFPATVGFGLLQRDRMYYNYEDSEARYESRPGVWVRLTGNWPAGHVRLLELPTVDEYTDNIVAAFVPDQPSVAGGRMDCTYEQSWTSRAVIEGPPGWVRATRRTARVDNQPGRTKFVVDFDPDSLAEVPADAEVTAEIDVQEPVQVHKHQVFRNDIDGSWRLTLTLDAPAGTPPAEIRARLMRDGQPVSETWTTLWEQ